MKKKYVLFLFVLVATVMTFISYSSSLKGEFVWDDRFLVLDNTYVKNWTEVPNIFITNMGQGADRPYSYWRPLQIFTYVLDYSFWKLNPLGYHLTNVLLHILVAVCLYHFSYILFADSALSFIAGIFFVVHPIHTEAVSYISGRADLLSALFVLLGLIFYIEYLKSERMLSYLLMFSCFILALLSKENSLVFPLLVLLYHLFFAKRIKITLFIPIAAVSLIYIFLRLTILKSALLHVYRVSGFFQRIPAFFAAIFNYTRLLLIPVGLHMDYGTPSFKFTDSEVLIGLFLCILFLGYAFKQRRDNKLIAFSIFWFFITLIPVSGIYALPFYMAEHFLYLPSVGFFLIITYIILRIFSDSKKLKGVATVVICGSGVLLTVLCYRQNQYWRTPISLYTRIIQFNPSTRWAYNNLGNAYLKKGMLKEAKIAYMKALQISPDNARLYNNLGYIYLIQRNYDESLKMLMKAVELYPRYTKAYYNLGLLYIAKGREKEAVEFFMKVIEINPYYAEAYYHLGNIFRRRGKIEEAIGFYKAAIEVNPQYAKVYNHLAVLYYSLGECNIAVEYCNKALSLGYAVDIRFLERIIRSCGKEKPEK